MEESKVTISLDEYRGLVEESVLLGIIESNLNNCNDWEFADRVRCILGVEKKEDNVNE